MVTVVFEDGTQQHFTNESEVSRLLYWEPEPPAGINPKKDFWYSDPNYHRFIGDKQVRSIIPHTPISIEELKYGWIDE